MENNALDTCIVDVDCPFVTGEPDLDGAAGQIGDPASFGGPLRGAGRAGDAPAIEHAVGRRIADAYKEGIVTSVGESVREGQGLGICV